MPRGLWRGRILRCKRERNGLPKGVWQLWWLYHFLRLGMRKFDCTVGLRCARDDLAGNGHFVLKKPIQLRLSFGQLCCRAPVVRRSAWQLVTRLREKAAINSDYRTLRRALFVARIAGFRPFDH